MKILLIGNFAPDRQESMLRFANLLASGLRGAGHDVSTWAPEPQLVRLLPRYRYRGPAKFVGYLDKFVLFPRRIRRRLRDTDRTVVHIVDHSNAVYAPLFAGRPLLVTCHDVLQIRSARGEFSQHRVGALGRRYQEWILANLARVPRIVVPSAQTAVELQRLAGVPAHRLAVIPHALNFPYHRASPTQARLVLGRMLRERQLPPGLLEHSGRGFVLNIGGGQWYKNREGLLHVYAGLRRRLAPPPRLVMVGKPLAPDLRALQHRLGLDADIVHLANVSETQLEALYSLAEALIFPSWHEGFGWPVAEAQACGCPVFTSDRPPMTEVGGDAACFIDPADPAGAARCIADAWPRRTEMSARGLARAGEWVPALMIERYVAAYSALAGTGAVALPA
ncbi:MAG TPA: glycosyltransferase family 1 protein [Opitutus sp.]|nr:glycosyltransferase family 1 protein [Opitutus sp.]